MIHKRFKRHSQGEKIQVLKIKEFKRKLNYREIFTHYFQLIKKIIEKKET